MKLRIYTTFILLLLLPCQLLADVGKKEMAVALAAEFYLQEQEYEKAFDQYEELAKTNSEEKVLRRLFDISLVIGKLDLIEKASKLIIKQKPNDIAANQNYLVVLIGQNKLKTARKQIKNLYKAVKAQKTSLLEVFKKLALIKNKTFVNSLLEGLFAKIKADKEDLHALAVFYSMRADFEKAIAKAEKSIALDPKWPDSSILKARVLYTQDLKDKAIEFIQDFYQQHNSEKAGATYARMLAGNGAYTEAAAIYEKLIKEYDDPDLKDSLAGLYTNLEQYPKALELFQNLADTPGYKDKANYFAGVIQKELGQLDNSRESFTKVGMGEFYLDARLNIGLLIAKTSTEAAIAYLDSIRSPSLKVYSRIITTKAEIYKNAEQLDKAYEVLSEALNEHMQSDLLYERALVAEKMGRIDSMEEDFLTIIENDPDNADALNALGFSLTEQTDRFLEALGYIEKALQLEPEQFYILDSMGWVQFKLGRIEDALKFLLKAYSKNQDPEVAAHISEVYLHTGDKSEAIKYLESGLKLNPEHPAVLKIKKMLEDKGIYQ